MQVLLIAVASAVFYLLAYRLYGRWLGSRVFRLSAERLAPSVEFQDGSDYVPTNKGVVFGHHFTSIAGTGPIVGPALAVVWGWLPALLWVLFGSVFIGAVHDFGALVVSMRNRGQTVGDVAGKVLGPRARLLFLLILFVALTIVLALFGLVIASVFRLFPQAILPCLLQIPIALLIGFFLHKKGTKLLLPSLAALGTMYLTVAFGDSGWLHTANAWLAAQSNIWWVAILLLYSAIASVIPVWALLQPRDYINSLQLLSALGLTVVGLLVAGVFGGAPIDGTRPALELVAPVVRSGANLSSLPLIFPFLFITIACGAISGFHCLVSSGTTSKQLRCETDARAVGFGSMLTEGFLAVIVILACVAGLGLGAGNGQSFLSGSALWESRYASWSTGAGLANTVSAFVDGSANFLRALGLSPNFATALMGVFVASFAATTLDTTCRLQRYVIQELGGQIQSEGFSRPRINRYWATAVAVLVAFGLALLPGKEGAPPGTGGLILWPLFGATNQLLGGLAFLVIYFWMRSQNMPRWFILPPLFFMLVLPAWALLYQIFVKSIDGSAGWLASGNVLLVGIGFAALALELWLLVEARLALKRLQPSTE